MAIYCIILIIIIFPYLILIVACPPDCVVNKVVPVKRFGQ